MKQDTFGENRLKHFHDAVYGKTNDVRNCPGQLYSSGGATAAHRARLIQEEANELIEALASEDAAAVLKECCDLIYVVTGTTVTYGWPLAPAFQRVHENNMLKIDTGDMSDSGKFVKSKDHPKVQLEDLVK